MDAQDAMGRQVRRQGPAAVAGLAQMYTTGEIAANIALETPGLDTLDILVFWKGFPTFASTQTIFTILEGQLALPGAERVRRWDPPPRATWSFPASTRTALALPWGGTCAPGVVQERSARGQRQGDWAACSTGPLMQGVSPRPQMVEEHIKPLNARPQTPRWRRWPPACRPTMPPRENPRINKSVDSVHASGPLAARTASSTATATTSRPACCRPMRRYSLLQQPPRRVGFASGCQAFGHHELLGAAAQLRPGARSRVT